MEEQDTTNRDPSRLENIFSGKTLEWAKAGDLESQFVMGVAYLGQADGNPELKETGRKFLYAAAEAGHSKAQCKLGQFLLTGQCGLKVDPCMGEVWIRKALANKEPDAYVVLYWAIQDGHINGTEEEAMAALRQGVELGSDKAQGELGRLLVERAQAIAGQDVTRSEALAKEGLRLLETASENGNLEASDFLFWYEEDLREKEEKKKATAKGKKGRGKRAKRK